MFFHFFIYHVDQSLDMNLCCCVDDLYFSVDPWEAFEIINGFTPQILPACIDCFWLEFIHYCFDENYCFSSAEGFPTVRDLGIWVGIDGCSNHLEDLASVRCLDIPNGTLVERPQCYDRLISLCLSYINL
jgi:hypothetical protein